MSWCNDCSDAQTIERISSPPSSPANNGTGNYNNNETVSTTNPNRTCSIIIRSCPSCGHQIRRNAQARIHDLPGLPAGVKFDPTDQELLHHLEAKARADACKLHPLIDEFIPTLEGENGICYAHPEKLPGVGKDGLIRHFFHRPSKAYTTGTRKRRKVLHTDEEDGETRWHKTGKTRPVFGGGKVKGYKKILVLYTNYGKQKKPEKTSWVMHQYHLGNNAEEKDGELVVSKVFYQTQPRHCGVSGSSTSLLPPKFIKYGSKQSGLDHHHHHQSLKNNDDHGVVVKYYNSAAAAASFMSFDDQGSAGGTGHFASHHHHDDRTSSFVP